MTATAVEAEDVRRAQARLLHLVRRTALLRPAGVPASLKCELAQVTGSFKFRGALNAVLAERPARVVAGSSGNHGLALAHAATLVGATATIFMTESSDPAKQAQIRRAGGTVVLCGEGNAARDRLAEACALRTGAALVCAHEHPAALAGYATAALEIVEQMPDVTDLFVPVGGGGLLAGACLAIRATRSRVRVIGVEPAGADAFARSLRASHPVTIDPPDTICDGARAQCPGELAFRTAEGVVDSMVAVPDAATVEAMRMLHLAGLPAEPTGALALAGLLAGQAGPRPVVVVSGGNLCRVTEDG